MIRWHGAYVRMYLERDIRSLYDIGSLREFEWLILEAVGSRRDELRESLA